MNTTTKLVADIIEGSADSIETAVRIAEALPLVRRKLIVELADEVERKLRVNGRWVDTSLWRRDPEGAYTGFSTWRNEDSWPEKVKIVFSSEAGYYILGVEARSEAVGTKLRQAIREKAVEVMRDQGSCSARFAWYRYFNSEFPGNTRDYSNFRDAKTLVEVKEKTSLIDAFEKAIVTLERVIAEA